MSKKALRFRGTPVPIQFQKLMRIEVFRVFTWKERLQILFGYRAVITAKIKTQHSPGKFQVDVQLTTTPNMKASDEVQNTLAK